MRENEEAPPVGGRYAEYVLVVLVTTFLLQAARHVEADEASRVERARAAGEPVDA